MCRGSIMMMTIINFESQLLVNYFYFVISYKTCHTYYRYKFENVEFVLKIFRLFYILEPLLKNGSTS